MELGNCAQDNVKEIVIQWISVLLLTILRSMSWSQALQILQKTKDLNNKLQEETYMSMTSTEGQNIVQSTERQLQAAGVGVWICRLMSGLGLDLASGDILVSYLITKEYTTMF